LYKGLIEQKKFTCTELRYVIGVIGGEIDILYKNIGMKIENTFHNKKA
jgi:hypothetical protein